MINMNFILGLSALLLVSAVSAQVEFTFRNNDYFTREATKVNREAAVKICADENAELAKITDSDLYYNILMKLFGLRAAGEKIYWIDGIYEAIDPNVFTLNEECTQGNLTLANIEYLPAAAKYCLAIEKGTNSETSKLRSLLCTQLQFVLCSKPSGTGCVGDGGVEGRTEPNSFRQNH